MQYALQRSAAALNGPALTGSQDGKTAAVIIDRRQFSFGGNFSYCGTRTCILNYRYVTVCSSNAVGRSDILLGT